MIDALIDEAAELLSGAGRICVSTGAGMSAESGVPTFRDEAGLWSNFNPDDYATPQAFARDPLKVWSWYRRRRANLRAIEPHAGHRLLAAWELYADELVVVTQNVDGLHHRAGSKRVIELHGRLDVARCTECSYEIAGLEDLGEDPRCPDCAARLRPGVVWFNEPLPEENLRRASDAAENCDVMLVIGTSGVVQPAASLIDTAVSCGAKLIEINPNETPYSRHADVNISAGCGEALTAIDEAWRRCGS
ncbi:MAG: NAD-dependent deacylase [Planctomycetes bacterium]|nr:NAD-dependent deacylase [Planctomycetota bacterium]